MSSRGTLSGTPTQAGIFRFYIQIALPDYPGCDPSSGLISGTPTVADTYAFTVYAKVNADSRSDTKALAIVVRDPLGVAASEPFTARRATADARKTLTLVVA
jgi:putative Ig domain-containing protein